MERMSSEAVRLSGTGSVVLTTCGVCIVAVDAGCEGRAGLVVVGAGLVRAGSGIAWRADWLSSSGLDDPGEV
jgi:hypothetical protein